MTDFDIFHNAPENATADELAAYLDEACGDDAELRSKVEALLAVQSRTNDFLEEVPVDLDLDAPTIAPDGQSSGKAAPPPTGSYSPPKVSNEQAGDTIGPFTLIKKLGEGGFGTVWKAEQSVPISRTVALKIIKLGMDTYEVLTRFEAERQALAKMNHENISKVLDAGATENGRPFFVMELVDGVPITKYCDEHHLDTQERLSLFRDVCAAVNHAHQKGLIHRDIKPSNVMVAEQDGKPAVKVIDFGIAKATEGKLTEETLITLQEQVIGTPAYMSPEQAGMDGLDIDTRSDIYSLGVLLYELLSGKPPFDPKTLLSAGFEEMRRIVREEEPPRPSFQVSGISDGEDGETILTTHGAGPQKLSRILRGDLDWIVMKAIEKDRGRRYETANAFAADIGHFLADEPVVAAKPSVGYQLHKFARRNKVALAVASVIVAVLVAATVVSSWLAVRAIKAEKKADLRLVEAEAAREEAEAVSTYLVEVFQSPDPAKDGRTITVVETLDQAVERLEAEFVDQPERKAQLQKVIARTYFALGMGEKTIPLQQEVVDYFRQTRGSENRETLNEIGTLSTYLRWNSAGAALESIPLQEEVLAARRETLGADHLETLNVMSDLTLNYLSVGRKTEALKMSEELLRRAESTLPRKSSRLYLAMLARASCLSANEQASEAQQLLTDALEECRDQFGAGHPVTQQLMRYRADYFEKAGRHEEALALRREWLEKSRESLGPYHPETVRAMYGIGQSLNKLGRSEEAWEIRQEMVTISREHGSGFNPAPAIDLFISQFKTQRWQEAIETRREIFQTLRAQKVKEGAPYAEWVKIAFSAAKKEIPTQDAAEISQMREEARQLAEAHLTPDKFKEIDRGTWMRSPTNDPLALKIAGAVTHAKEKRWDEALALSVDLREQIRELDGPSQYEALESMRELARLFHTAHIKPEEALAIREAFLEACRKVNGPDHDQTGYGLISVSNSLFDAGQFEEALALREQALVIAEKNPGSNLIFWAKMALAGSHTQAGRFEAAMALIEAALPFARQIRGPEDLMTLNILSNLANHCEKTGRSAESIEHGEELVAIRRKLDPDLKDHQTIWAMQALAAYYETAGKKEQAKAILEEIPPEPGGDAPPPKEPSADDSE